MPAPPEPTSLTYEPYFGLGEKPFSLNADARFIYQSPAYVATRDSMLAGIRRREGLLVLTGEIGTGKTTLCRAVLRDLGRKTCSAFVPDPFASREDLLKMLLIDFGVASIPDVTTGPLKQASRTELGYLLAEFLESLTPDAFAIVIMDEAQNLSLPLIEETRILADTFGAAGKMQIIFVGQPELHAKLKLPEMRQVDQRVCGYHRLAPLTRESVAGYLQHRLQVAGGRPNHVLFAPDTSEVLHQRCGGVPRLINRVCDRALHLAFEQRAECVTRTILDTALLEVGSTTLSPTWDSIIYAQTTAVVAPPVVAPPAVAAPAPARPPQAVETPAKNDDEHFEQQIASWVDQDLPSPARTPARVAAGTSEKRPSSKPAARRPSPQPPVTIDWPRDVRSETYMQRLLRKWAKWAAFAVGGFLALNVLIAAASLLPAWLNPAATPAPAEKPAAAVASPASPQTPATDAHVPPGASAPAAGAPTAPAAAVPVPVVAAAVAPAPAQEFLVAVGLFASQERADQLADTLTRAGLPAMQRTVQLRRQPVQQIVLGPFFSRSEALADLRRLQQLGGYDDAHVIDSARDPNQQ